MSDNCIARQGLNLARFNLVITALRLTLPSRLDRRIGLQAFYQLVEQPRALAGRKDQDFGFESINGYRHVHSPIKRSYSAGRNFFTSASLGWYFAPSKNT